MSLSKLNIIKIAILVFVFTFSFLLMTSGAYSQIKQDSTSNASTFYVYERYDKDGNTCFSIEPPTTEIRYDCPVCDGARVLSTRNTGVPVNIVCWRCNGKGYLVSSKGK
ncbi:MAG: hypothetical protein WC644_12300 [Ignavibacteria bacterium]